MRRILTGAVLMAVLGIGTVAHAQGKAANIAQAEKLFDEAKALLESNRTSEACARFAESQKLDPQIGTVLNLALCNEQIGKNASAWAQFNEVIGLATRAGQTKRADLANKHAMALEGSLARVKLDLSRAPRDVVLLLDGEPLDVAVARATPVPVDPGSHAIGASAPNRAPITVTFEVRKGSSDATVFIPALAGTSALAERDTPPTAASSSAPWKTVGYVTGGVGAGALVFGLVAGGIALGKKDTAESDCAGFACKTTAGFEANESAHTWATVSTVSVVGGVVLLGAAAVLILLAPSGTSTSASLGSYTLDLQF